MIIKLHFFSEKKEIKINTDLLTKKIILVDDLLEFNIIKKYNLKKRNIILIYKNKILNTTDLLPEGDIILLYKYIPYLQSPPGLNFRINNNLLPGLINLPSPTLFNNSPILNPPEPFLNLAPTTIMCDDAILNRATEPLSNIPIVSISTQTNQSQQINSINHRLVNFINTLIDEDIDSNDEDIDSNETNLTI